MDDEKYYITLLRRAAESRRSNRSNIADDEFVWAAFMLIGIVVAVLAVCDMGPDAIRLLRGVR